MDGGIHVACRCCRRSGRAGNPHRSGSVAAASASERCAATDTRGAWGRRGPTKGRREAASSDVCPHPDNWSRPANSSVSGNYWILLEEEQLQGSARKWALTCGNGDLAATRYARTAATFHAGTPFPRAGLEDRPRSSSTSPTCANTGSARPGMRGTRAECRVRWLMRCAERAGPRGATVHAGTTRGRAWTGMDAGARPFMRGVARAFRSVRGSVESAPIRGIVDGSCDRLCVRAGRSSATDYAHEPVTRSAKAVTGSRPPMRTFRHARGDLDRLEAGGGRPFMRSSDRAPNCRLRRAADRPRTTGATAYA